MRTRLTQLAAAALLVLCSCGQSPAKQETRAATPTVPKTASNKATTAAPTTPAPDKRAVPYGAVDLGLSVYWADTPSYHHSYWGGSPNEQECTARYIPGDEDWTYFGTPDEIWRNDPGYIINWLDREDLRLMGITDANNNLIGDPNGWRKPTKDEMEELVNLCKWEKTGNWLGDYDESEDLDKQSPGYKVTGPNGISIFLPTNGIGYGRWGRVDPDDYVGAYWTATAGEKGAYALMFDENGVSVELTHCAQWIASISVYGKHKVAEAQKAHSFQKRISAKVVTGTEVKYENRDAVISGNSVRMEKNAPFKWPMCVGVAYKTAQEFEATPDFKDVNWKISPIVSDKSYVTENTFEVYTGYLEPRTKYYYKAVVTWQGELYFADNTESFTTPDF